MQKKYSVYKKRYAIFAVLKKGVVFAESMWKIGLLKYCRVVPDSVGIEGVPAKKPGESVGTRKGIKRS
jgi:hypothetical protein